MSRVFRSQSLHTQRQRLLKLLAYTLRALIVHGQRDAEARDMAAFLALLLDDIQRLVDTTTTAWEKKGFWLKADKFRRDWAWAPRYRDLLYLALTHDDWDELVAHVAQLFSQVSTVQIPKHPRWSERPWEGAWETLKHRVDHEGLANG